MDGDLMKISSLDADVDAGYPSYRSQQYLNDYSASVSTSNSLSYGFNNLETPLHATETHFLMETLNVAAQSPAYPEFETASTGTTMSAYPLPSTAASLSSADARDSMPSSVSGSHRSSDSDDDGDDHDLHSDTSTLTKEELRKHKNRQSAARSRKRSRDRMGQLETLVRQLSVKNRQLEEQIQALLLERAAVERHAHIAPPPPPHHHQPHHHQLHHQHHAYHMQQQQQPMASHLPVHTAYY